MSVWRTQIDIAFKTEDDMVAFLNLIESMDEKLATKKDGSLYINKKVIYHECHHDTGGACGGYMTFEFNGVQDYEKKDGQVVEASTIISDDLKDKIVTKAAIDAGKLEEPIK